MTSDKERENTLDKKTLVFGASLNPMRVSHQAVQRLAAKGLRVVAIGGRHGFINDVPIHREYQEWKDIHTITLYMGYKRQSEHIDYFLSLKPKRIIFNPGAENHELFMDAKEQGIEVLNACTLVMLSTGQY
ncbi:MAG: CoA-binding protein [Saprospiraceae bacterium]|nr:CoA-binding protein [Saprospiraceae bacterium]